MNPHIDLTDLRARLDDLLHAKPSSAVSERLCDLLDDCPEDHLEAATQHILRVQQERWPEDLNPGRLWPFPRRAASQRWIKRLLKGDTPPAWHLAQLLQLHDKPLKNDDLRKLLDNPALSSITHLYLAQCSLGPPTLPDLAQTTHLTHLTHLNLEGNPLAPDTLAPLLDTPLAARLQLLNLSRSKLHTADLQALLTSRLPQLHTLLIGATATPREDLTRLLLDVRLPHLTTLSLDAFTSTTGQELASDDSLPAPIRQAIWRGWISRRGASELKKLAAQLHVSASKRSRNQLIDALAALPPTPP